MLLKRVTGLRTARMEGRVNDKIKVIEMSDLVKFEFEVNSLLEDGYKISSTNCGFVNSERYDFCGSYQAILLKDGAKG